jgi:hypothetical protein
VPAPPEAAFRAAVELAPVPVALVSGPEPLRLEWANAALRELPGAPAPGARLDTLASADTQAFAVLHEHLTGELPAGEAEHPAWDGGSRARSVVYRLPVASGTRPLLAVVGVETAAERAARTELAAAQAEIEELRRRGERHDRWLDAIAGLAAQFQHEPGPDAIGATLDVLIRQTGAIDASLATYAAGRLELPASRRGVLAPAEITVAAHPGVGRALRDAEGHWLDATTEAAAGVPEGLHAAGLPISVAGDVLGLLVMVFDEVEPHDDDNRRLLAAVSAGMGFALLRDRLVRELRATLRDRPARRPTRFVRQGAAVPPPGG